MTVCQLQTAKQRFSSVAESAAKGIPQLVTKHGRPFVVIVSAADWCREHEPERGIWDVLRDCPADLSELDSARNKDLPGKLSFWTTFSIQISCARQQGLTQMPMPLNG